MPAINISTVKPNDFQTYFIDCNVWLAWFKHQRTTSLKIADETYPEDINPKSHYNDYLIFIEELIESHINYDEVKDANQKNPKPKILFTSLLATEIVNAYSRNISLRLYDFGSQTKTPFKEYRGTSHYKKELKMLIDDILTFKDYCLCTNDDFNELDFFSSISTFTTKHDFNDFFYMKSCEKWSCPIVTHDGDFDSPYNQILTVNRKILNPPAKQRFGR